MIVLEKQSFGPRQDLQETKYNKVNMIFSTIKIKLILYSLTSREKSLISIYREIFFFEKVFMF